MNLMPGWELLSMGERILANSIVTLKKIIFTKKHYEEENRNTIQHSENVFVLTNTQKVRNDAKVVIAASQA